MLQEKGVTLIEIIVGLLIISLFSAILVSNFPEIQRRFALSRTVYKVAQDARKAEDLGMSGILFKDSRQTQIPASGYGIYFNLNSETEYAIYADVDGSKNFNNLAAVLCENYDILTGDLGDCNVEVNSVSAENKSVYVKQIKNEAGSNFNSASINFLPPNPAVEICGGSVCGIGSIEIVLGLQGSGITRSLIINSSGLIKIQ